MKSTTIDIARSSVKLRTITFGSVSCVPIICTCNVFSEVWICFCFFYVSANQHFSLYNMVIFTMKALSILK